MNVKRIKVLAIGNSFSVDSMEYLFPLLEDGRFDQIVLGDLYIGGCSLETHAHNALTNNKDYLYFLNTTGAWEEHEDFSILEALNSEKWDIITIQQCSGKSGLPDSFQPYLDQLIKYIREDNREAKLYWNMTWAYHNNSNHEEFINYDSNQIKMYEAIISSVKEQIVSNENINGIIPVGTAIQNIRTLINDDLLTRDGYHLSLEIGRFVASLTWFKSLTGLDLTNITCHPDNIDQELFDKIKKAVNAALINPFSITN